MYTITKHPSSAELVNFNRYNFLELRRVPTDTGTAWYAVHITSPNGEDNWDCCSLSRGHAHSLRETLTWVINLLESDYTLPKRVTINIVDDIIDGINNGVGQPGMELSKNIEMFDGPWALWENHPVRKSATL